jgi:hypothetical protein
MLRGAFCWLLVGVAVALVGVNATPTGQPGGQLTIAFDTTIAPAYLDPAETTGLAAPFVFLYALHDALVKPLPGNHMAPCLVESWTESADGLVYEFKLRQGLMFHNGDPFTAEDVHFSFLRYRGTSAKLLHEQVKAIEIIDALFQQQAVERDRTRREALLHQMQRLMQERVMHAPIAEPAALHGVGPRVGEPGVGLIPLFAYFGPYEEMRLKRP